MAAGDEDDWTQTSKQLRDNINVLDAAPQGRSATVTNRIVAQIEQRQARQIDECRVEGISTGVRNAVALEV